MPFGWGKKESQAGEPDRRLLDAFAAALPGDPGSAGPTAGWTERQTRDLLGRDVPLFTAFQADVRRSSVGGGALRFLAPDSDPSLLQWNGRGGWRLDWPSIEPGVVFASDWMGRLFLLATKRKRSDGEPPVAVLDPTTGELVVLDDGFGEFLGDTLASDWRGALEVDRLDAWRAAGGFGPAFDQCVVPKTPLVLGGSDQLEDLEISSLVVAVSFAGQIWEQVKDLPVGTKITGVRVE